MCSYSAKINKAAGWTNKKKRLGLTSILRIEPLYIFVNHKQVTIFGYKLNHFTMVTRLKGVWDAPLVNQYDTDSIGIFAHSKDTLAIVNFISSRFLFPRESF